MSDAIQDMLARAVNAAANPENVSEAGGNPWERHWLAVFLGENVELYVPRGGAFFLLGYGPILTTVYVDASALWEAALLTWNAKMAGRAQEALKELGGEACAAALAGEGCHR